MERFEYVVVGGGLAAASAVEGIREVDEEGAVALLSEESEPPYHRPPLSKEYLQVPAATREMLHVKPEGWYEGRDVELRLETRVETLDADAREVVTASSDRLRGERVLLATGGTARSLPIPGSELDGVFTLRSVEDAEAIQAAARETDEAVLVGAGFIGMELAASLRELDVRPTVVEVEDRVWARMLSPEASRFMKAYFEARGVRFRTSARVEELRGDGSVREVALAGGDRLPAGLVVVGVGIEPATGLAEAAGLAVSDGVVVDRFGETSHAYVYAAGDVAEFPDPVFDDLCRVEHWDHAKFHGKSVGRNMAGAAEPYDHLSYFFSDVFDLSLSAFGRPGRADRVVIRGALGEDGCVVFCAAEGRLCGALLFDANEAMDPCRELVRARPPMEELEDRLADPSVDLVGLEV